MVMHSRILRVGLFVGTAAWSTVAGAQFVIPGAADAARVGQPAIEMEGPRAESDASVPQFDGTQAAPAGAEQVKFVLKRVDIHGMKRFPISAMDDIYRPYLNKEVTLDIAWLIAGRITERYRAAGYFLSRAYVPQQSVKDGALTIAVVEGHVGHIEIKGDGEKNRIALRMARELEKEIPLKAKSLESFLLRLNDIPGETYRAVLSADKAADEGMVRLTLVPGKDAGHGSISIDNYGSRFLGPHQATATYSFSPLANHQTSLTGLTSLPMDELNYGGITHEILLRPNLSLVLNGSYSSAEPGSTLEPLDIVSDSLLLGTALRYQWIRQRHTNLALKLGFDGRNTDSDISGTPLVRDRIRAIRLNANYDYANTHGVSTVQGTISQGVSIFGASDSNDPNLSRGEAKPDFTKAELTASHLRPLSEHWQVFGAVAGQVASGPLYSAEEFGYGGQFIGRAYDSSELTGDHGLSGLVELRYSGFGEGDYKFYPYASYDAGIAWNMDDNTPDHASGSSAGLGVRFVADRYATGAFGVSLPLTRDVSAPLYGASDDGPRISFQLMRDF